MVLKSVIRKGRAGSTPALGTTSFTALCITFRTIILYLGLTDEGKMRDTSTCLPFELDHFAPWLSELVHSIFKNS